MTTTPSSPKKVVYAGSGNYDAFLSDHYIGTFRSEIQAWTELNQVPFEQSRRGAAMETPVSVGDEPASETASDELAPTQLPVPAAELRAAAARLRPDPAIHKALKRLLEGGWSYQDDDSLVVTFDPRSKGRKGKPARPYTTTADSCTCPGAIIRGGCYHPVAWQVVNEARVPTTSIQYVLPSTMFLPLCLLALSAGTDQVILRADSGRGTLTLAAPQVVTGTISVEIATPVLLTIEQQVRATDLTRVIDALACALPSQGEQLLLEINTGSLLIIAGTEDTPMFVDGLDTLPMDQQNDIPT